MGSQPVTLLRRQMKTAVLVGFCFGVIPHTARGQASMPRLQRVPMPLLDSLGPEKADATVAISPQGIVAFTGALDANDRAVTLFDSSGRLMARLGPPGQGPGELSLPVQLAFAGRELIVVELGTRRVSRFGLDGSSKGTSAMATPLFLAAGTGDSIDVFQFPSGPSAVLDFRRLSPVSMDGRFLLSGQAPSLRDLSNEGRQSGAAVASVIYAAVGSTVVAANVATYRLVGIGSDGRTLFDLRGKQADVPAGETPLFSIGGLQVDGKQRVWAIGADHKTGRTFADLYLGGRVLGRLDLPCRGAVAVGGTRMAILCAAPETASRDVTLQVYRIVEPR
jgi:hypothetical protein